MLKFYIFIMALLICKDIQAQTFTAAALSKTVKNQFGDPITNQIDADGLKQGLWMYTDIYGKPIVKEHYSDGNCIEVNYLINDIWENNHSVEINTRSKNELIDSLNQNGIQSNWPDDQQLIFIFDSQGKHIQLYFLGNWQKDVANQIHTDIQQLTLTTHFRQDTYGSIIIL